MHQVDQVHKHNLRQISVCRINFSIPGRNRVEDDLNSGFICIINPFNKNLLFNPHQLPCGNISCLTCIYDNYNLLTN